MMRLILAVAVLSLASPPPVTAQCRNGVCRQVVKQQVVQQPAFIQQPVAYRVGSYVQQQAVATASLRQSDEYIELQQLRGFRAGVEAMLQQQQATLPVEVEPPPAEEHARKFPTLVANCAKCHSGDEPKAGLWLDGSVDITTPAHAETRDRLLREIYNNRMPPKGGLTDERFGAVLSELYAEVEEQEQ